MLARLLLTLSLIFSSPALAGPSIAGTLRAVLGWVMAFRSPPPLPSNLAPYQPILYRVTHPSFEVPCSYILATMHYGVWDVEIPDEVWHALDSSHRLVAESKPPDDYQHKLGRLEPLQQWTKRLTQRERQKLLDLRVAAGDPEPENIFRASLDYVLVDPSLFIPAPKRRLPIPETAEQEWGQLVSSCMDLSIVERAREAGKSIRTLNGPEVREMVAEVFFPKVDKTGSGRSQTEVDAVRLKTLRWLLRLAHWQTYLGTVCAINFRTGIPEALEQLATILSKGTNGRLLEERNAQWLPIFAQEIETGGAFIAVGAAHFVGPNGLTKLMEAEGFVLERVLATPKPVPIE